MSIYVITSHNYVMFMPLGCFFLPPFAKTERLFGNCFAGEKPNKDWEKPTKNHDEVHSLDS